MSTEPEQRRRRAERDSARHAPCDTTAEIALRPDTAWLERLAKRIGTVRSSLDPQTRQKIHNSHGSSATPDPHEDSDDIVLRHVLDQLTTQPLSTIAKGITTTHLDQIRPGLRSKTYRRFRDTRGLAFFALTAAVEPDRSELTSTLADCLAQAVADPDLDHSQVVVELGKAYFNAVCDDPCLVYQTYAWLGARESMSLRTSFDRLYRYLDSTVSEGLDMFLSSWGRRPTGSLSTTDLSAVATSLIEGLAMRTAVSPDSISDTLAATSLRALLFGLTEPVMAAE